MKVIRAINHFCTWLCMLFIVVLMLLMVGEVFLRTFFNSAILGATEWASVLLLFELLAVGSSILCNRMIKVNMVTSKLPNKVQVILDIILLFICFAAIGFTAWRQVIYATQELANKVLYSSIKVPEWPLVLIFAIGYGVAALTTLTVAIRKLVNAFKGKWDLEAELEDADPLYAFGKNLPPRIQALIDGKPIEKKGGDDK